jgi:hypothetical protein
MNLHKYLDALICSLARLIFADHSFRFHVGLPQFGPLQLCVPSNTLRVYK